MRGPLNRYELMLVIAAPCATVAAFVAVDSFDWWHRLTRPFGTFALDEVSAVLFGLVLALLWVLLRRRRTTVAQFPERDAAELALRESEMRFRAIYDNAGVGILLASSLGQILSANKAFQNLVGYDDGELRQIGWNRIIHPEEGGAKGLRTSADRGIIGDNSIERKFVRKSGESISVKLTTSYAFDEDGRPILGIAVAEDVTPQRRAEEVMQNAKDELERRVDLRTQEMRREIAERVKAEEALGESEKKFRALIENALDFVLVLDNSGTIRFQSPSMETELGFGENELVGTSVFDGIHPADVDRVKKSFAQVIQVPNSTDFLQFRVRNAKGGWRIIEAASKNLLHNPIVNGVVINSRDVTERCRAEESARNRENELAHVARLSTVGEMAAGFARELNQPLTAIQNYASGCVRRLRAGGTDKEQLCAAMESTVTQAQRASEIIRRIRWFIRRDAPEMAPVDINTVVREALALMESDAHHAGISVRFDLAPNLPWARADTTQIQQAVISIARNGMEAMSGNDQGLKELIIRSQVTSNDEIEISVRDCGPGIPAEIKDRLFDPFFTTKSDGLGMGLSICRAILERHDGRIYLGSNSGPGAEIRFTLQTFENVVPLTRGAVDTADASGKAVDSPNGHTLN